jgi:ABC-2 type transport system permease protein
VTSGERSRGSVSTEFVWQLRRRRMSLIGWSVALIAVASIYIPFYPAMGGGAELDALISSLPPELVTALGYDTIGTPAGYLTATIFGLLGPALLLVFAIGAGARAIAGEEQDGRLELTAAAPISRERLVSARALALVTSIGVLATVICVASLGLSAAVGLEVTTAGVVAARVGLFLLAAALALLALGAGAASGRYAIAVIVGASVAVGGYIADALADLVPRIQFLGRLSPFAWYLGNDPILNGLDPLGTVLLVLLGLCGWGLAVLGIRRRDLGV